MDSSAIKTVPPSVEALEKIRDVLRVLLLAVFLGTLVLWIIMPTNIYKLTWQPRIRAATNNSTCFGNEGSNLLIFTFPVLLAASVGGIYLHLGKKIDAHKTPSNGKKSHMSYWRKPVLWKGPLGIVSGTEIGFFMMFLALLVWSLSSYLHNSFANITRQSTAEEGEKVWQSRLEISGLRLGLVGNICLAFLFFPAARGSSVLPLFGLTSESSIRYHIWLGHITLTIFAAHGLCYIIYWASTNQISQMLHWDRIGVSNVAGEIALLAGLFMWATTLSRIRRKIFELFFYTHNLYVLFVVFFIFHVGISYSCIMLPGFYLFVVDRYLRFLQSRRRVRLVSARVLPCQTLELNFSKSPGLSYNPTSIVFINVPGISKLQWHPFTVTSSSSLEPEKLSVVIKGTGSWTKKLYQMLSSPSSLERLEVSVEGPYGPFSTNLLRHETLMMVSGGSGITPFISIIRELIFISKALKMKMPNVILICAFKNSSELTMLDLLLPVSGSIADLNNLRIEIEAFVTREKEPAPMEHSKLRTIWFKPLPTDSPMSAILGPSSWLWLGVIIASSFAMFLVLIGLITTYYIYPVDHNSNKIFVYASRSAINMVIICLCIAITASSVVFLNKKRNGEEKQIQNHEGPSPMVSPRSWFYNSERELESHPQQSLLQAINMHYGERPNLRSIILDCKGSSVGVLVSGPKAMRHEVAAICASGLAHNLSFESVSFTW